MNLENLVDLARRISLKVEIQYVYRLLFTTAKADYTRLIIVYSAVPGKKHSQVEAAIKTTLSGLQIEFIIHDLNEVLHGLNSGITYFHALCQETNQLFKHPEAIALPFFEGDALREWKNRILEDFGNRYARAYFLIDGVKPSTGQPNITAFMMHQALELTFRMLEISILGKEKTTHSLQRHLPVLFKYLPLLAEHFPDSTEDDDLLQLLDKAFIDVSARNNFKFPGEHIDSLFKRIKAFMCWTGDFVESMTSVFDLKSACETAGKQPHEASIPVAPEGDKMVNDIESGRDNDDFICEDMHPSLDQIVRFFLEKLSPESIYIFGTDVIERKKANLFSPNQSGHQEGFRYALLVLTPVDKPYSKHLHNLINSKRFPNLVVTSLLHHPQDAAKKLVQGNRFFQTVFSHGKLLYSRIPKMNIPNILTMDLDKVAEGALNAYGIRSRRASILLQIAINSKNEDSAICVLLLADALVQQLLAYINLVSGYQPNHYSLEHLISICKIYWPECESYIPGGGKNAVLSTLDNIHSKFKYGTNSDITEGELTTLFCFCEVFINALQRKSLMISDDLKKHIEQAAEINLNL